MKIKVHNPNNLPLIDYRELEPLQGNLKVLSPENYQKLLHSFNEKGFFVPFYVWKNPTDKKQYAIDGHQRLTVLKGENALPRLIIEAETLQEAKEKLLAVTSQYGTITEEGLQEFLMDIDITDFLKTSTNFDLLPDFFENLGVDPEQTDDQYKVPALDQIKTDIIPGDTFTIGRHRLICGDCRSHDLMARLMAGKKIDLVLIDPPYNVDYTGGTPDALQLMNDNQTDADFYKFLEDSFKSIFNYSKPGGAWYVWHADSEGLNFRTAFEQAGVLMKQCLIWVKNSMVMGRQDYQWRHEPCLYGWKPGASHYFTKDRTNTTVYDDKIDYGKMKKTDLLRTISEMINARDMSTVLYYNKPMRNDIHPTMKPVPLIADQIINSSQVGEIIADTFGGSGTTMVASHQMNRTCYMMDLDPRCCHVIIDRMLKLDGSLEITKNGTVYDFQKIPT